MGLGGMRRFSALGSLSAALRSQFEGLRTTLNLLGPGQRRRYIVVSVLQALLGILDIIGIALIGLVAAVLASGLDPDRMPPYVERALSLGGLASLTLTQAAAVFGALAVLVLLAKSVAGVAFTRYLYDFLAKQQADVSERLVAGFLSQPLLRVQRWATPEAQYALTLGVGFGVVIALGGASSALAEVVLFMVIALALLAVDPALSFMVAGVFGLVGLYLQFGLGRRTGRESAALRDSTVALNSTVLDSMTTYREAVVLNRRELFVRRFGQDVRRNAGATAELQYVLEVPKYLLESLLVIVAFLLALAQLTSKDLPNAAATVALFLTAGFRAIPAMLRLQAAAINVRRGLEGAQPTLRMADELDLDAVSFPDTTREAMAVAHLREQVVQGHEGFIGDVRVDGVTFTYFGSQRASLRNVSLDARVGSSTAIVGSTGAGKSTLVDVILGVIEPDRGEVAISGMSPRDAVRQWSGAIGYVPQSVALIDGTVRENVALGLPSDHVDDEFVWEALEQAHLAEFLRSSRDGLDTLVGERGVHLSGGQRQRLGIARALFTRPVVLVMDEATSALDAETESTITQTLRRLEGKVTTITVAHRLATVRFADQLLFMRDGEIVARGSFEEVRAQEPDFARQAKLLGL